MKGLREIEIKGSNLAKLRGLGFVGTEEDLLTLRKAMQAEDSAHEDSHEDYEAWEHFKKTKRETKNLFSSLFLNSAKVSYVACDLSVVFLTCA